MSWVRGKRICLMLGIVALAGGVPPVSADVESDAPPDGEAEWIDAGDLGPAPADYRPPPPVEHLGSWMYPYPESRAGKASGPPGDWYIRVGGSYYDVDDDRGRFRQDRFTDDRWTGGLEELFYSSEPLSFRIRAIAEDDFLVETRYTRPDVVQVDGYFRKVRKYFDGSNEPWDPTLFLLPEDFADFDDDNLYVDRIDLRLEATLLVPDLPHVKVGWHRWERFGDDVLLWGGLAQNNALLDRQRQRSIPVINDVDGVSDTIFIEVPFTIQDKYNVTIRQEWEKYQDDQQSEAPSFNVGGGVPVFNETLTHIDDLEWREWRTRIDVDAFLTDGVYASYAYYHSDLESRSARDVLRPGPNPSGGRSRQFAETDVDTQSERDIMALGLVLLNVAHKTDLSANLRLEYEDRTGEHNGFETPFFGVQMPVLNAVRVEEFRVGEEVRLVSKRWANTTLTLEGEWEQRFEDTREIIESVNAYKTDIDTVNQEYTAKMVRRLGRKVKWTGRYRYRDDHQDYDTVFDVDPDAYPGILLDWDEREHTIMTKVDYHFLPAWTASGSYEYESSEIEFDRAGTEAQDLDAHRAALTVFGNPCPRLTATGMVMYENYQIDTPTFIPFGASNWAAGTDAFDYEYEVVVGFASMHYAFNDRWGLDGAYQHTQAYGEDVDNTLHEIWLGAEFKWTENKTVHWRYEYFDFDDDHGDGFDDYRGHGIALSLAYRF